MTQPSTSESEKGELFTFEVVRVDNYGHIIQRSQGSARQKIENLGNDIKLEIVYTPGGSFIRRADAVHRYGKESKTDACKAGDLERWLSQHVPRQRPKRVVADRVEVHFVVNAGSARI